MCGGTQLAVAIPKRDEGLSPRVRGNLLAADGAVAAVGSIPACAGEPPSTCSTAWARGVYPRVCGGTAAIVQVALLELGLSPRVRGNQWEGIILPVDDGSIPACAGEPERTTASRYGTRVYPRVCGGTSSWVVSSMRATGLSPRVRGNP